MNINDLKAQWNALPLEEQNEYREDYAQMVVDSGKDADDHTYAPLLKRGL